MFMTSIILRGMPRPCGLRPPRLQGSFDGLDLTVATLNTILKYAGLPAKTGAITHKKVGYFHAGRPLPGYYCSQTGAGSQL